MPDKRNIGILLVLLQKSADWKFDVSIETNQFIGLDDCHKQEMLTVI